MYNLIQGDCLEKMKDIPDKSIDFILTDPPYGTTACKWDILIPFEPMWKELTRIIKPNGAIALFGSEPFTSLLITSNLNMFKYTWCWNKVNGVRNHLNAKKQPMRIKEDICVFYNKQCTYNPIMRKGSYTSRKTKPGHSDCYGKVTGIDSGRLVTELYPIDILNIKSQGGHKVHPTQKPTQLLEYLIKTYTLEGETVLDFTMGSGSTGVACLNINRNFIGIEKDEHYFEVAKNRIEETEKELQNRLL